MKHTQLSNFQKQQYTSYLETQLQKFSTFMLSQRKENQKYKVLEQLLSHHSNLIHQLQSKISITQLYQQQNMSNFKNLFSKCEKQQDLDIRLRRLEDREIFDCDREIRKKYEMNKKQQKNCKQEEMRERNGEISSVELSKRLKRVQEDLSHLNKGIQLSKRNNNDDIQISGLIEEKTNTKLKKFEKKMKKYFSSKFEDIESLLLTKKKKKSKSPSARTPIEMSSMSYYEVEPSQMPLTQFKLEDTYQSSVIKSSNNTTISNKNKENVDQFVAKKGKRYHEEKQKKSRSKSKSKGKKRDRSMSQSQGKSKSKTLSDNSFLSSLSKSKSHISKQELKISTKDLRSKSKIRKGKRSVSKSKSNHSSHSLHDKCKRRPLIDSVNENKQNQPKKSKNRSKR